MNELLSRYIAYKFIVLLTTPWIKQDAYKLGLIDDKGKLVRKPETQEERKAYTTFHKLVFNLKRLLQKMPFGSWRLSSYAAALYLLRDQYGLDKDIVESIVRPHIKDLFLCEDTSHTLNPGKYTLSYPHPYNPTRYKQGDVVTISKDEIDQLFNTPLYRAKHHNTGDVIVVGSGHVKAKQEDVIPNTSGGPNIAGMDQPIIKQPTRRKKPDDQFAGSPVFDVDSETYKKCMHGKPAYARWRNFVDVEEDLESSIKSYAHKNPASSIVLRNKTTGAMVYLKRR